MTSWNELFHSAENPSSRIDSSIKNKIAPSSIVQFVATIDAHVAKLMEFHDKHKKDGMVGEDFKEYMGKLSWLEKRLLPEYLLRIVEFCQMAGDYNARNRIFGTLDCLYQEFKLPPSRYETQMN